MSPINMRTSMLNSTQPNSAQLIHSLSSLSRQPVESSLDSFPRPSHTCIINHQYPWLPANGRWIDGNISRWLNEFASTPNPKIIEEEERINGLELNWPSLAGQGPVGIPAIVPFLIVIQKAETIKYPKYLNEMYWAQHFNSTSNLR